MSSASNPHEFVNKLIIRDANPHLSFLRQDNIPNILNFYIDKIYKSKNSGKVDFLDVGGGKGWGDFLRNDTRLNQCALDIAHNINTDNITFYQGDITDPELDLPQFDIVFSKDTLEHILEPWTAAKKMSELVVNNGIVMCMMPFCWRYHASPQDVSRFTHTGLRYLFEKNGDINCIFSGYMLAGGGSRGFWGNKKDWTPNNNRLSVTPIESVYIGTRVNGITFNLESLDNDFSGDHKH